MYSISDKVKLPIQEFSTFCKNYPNARIPQELCQKMSQLASVCLQELEKDQNQPNKANYQKLIYIQHMREIDYLVKSASTVLSKDPVFSQLHNRLEKYPLDKRLEDLLLIFKDVCPDQYNLIQNLLTSDQTTETYLFIEALLLQLLSLSSEKQDLLSKEVGDILNACTTKMTEDPFTEILNYPLLQMIVPVLSEIIQNTKNQEETLDSLKRLKTNIKDPNLLALMNEKPLLAQRALSVLSDKNFPSSLARYLSQYIDTYLKVKLPDRHSLAETRMPLDTVLRICEKDPLLLIKLIQLESITGVSFLCWVEEDFSQEPIQYLLDHLQARHFIMEKLPSIMEKPAFTFTSTGGIIPYQEFKQCVQKHPQELERLFDCFGESYELMRVAIHTLSSEDTSSTLQAFTRLDPSTAKQYRQELRRLAEFLLPSNYMATFLEPRLEEGPNSELVKQVLQLLEKKEFNLFKRILPFLNTENQQLVTLFLSVQEEGAMPFPELKKIINELLEKGYLKFGLFLSALYRPELSHYYKQIGDSPNPESIGAFLHHLISQSEEKDQYFRFVSKLVGESPDFSKLSVEEQQVLLEIYLLKVTSDQLERLLTFASNHPPTFTLRFLHIARTNVSLAEHLARWIEAVPEAAMKLLVAAECHPEKMEKILGADISESIKEALPLSEDPYRLLESWAQDLYRAEKVLKHPKLLSNKTQLLTSTIRSLPPDSVFLEDPEWDSLIEMTDLMYHRGTIPLSKKDLAVLQFFPNLALKYVEMKERSVKETGFLENIDQLIQRHESERPFISKLLTLQSLNKTQLVFALLKRFPIATELALNLVDLAVAGYDDEVQTLLKREQESFIQVLLKAGHSSRGPWIQSALQLDPSADKALIEALIKAPFPPESNPLLLHLTDLAVSGHRDLVAHFVNGLPDSSPISEKMLAAWIENGELTRAVKIWTSDSAYRENPLYKQIREQADPRLQEQLLSLFFSEHQQVLSFAFKLFQEGISLDKQCQSLARLHYLLSAAPDELKKIIDNPPADTDNALNLLFAQCHPAKEIDEWVKSQASSFQGKLNMKALAEQQAFVTAAAKSLLMADGEINRELFEEIKKSAFYEKQRAEQSTVFQFLEWTFHILAAKGELSARLAVGVESPSFSSPSALLLRKLLHLDPDASISKKEAQAGILSALLQRPWQSSGVGSCFGTSVVIRSHHSEWQLRQTLDDYILMIKNGSLTRYVEGGLREFPVSMHPSIQEESAVAEHPLSKTREYLVSSMYSYGEGLKPRKEALETLFGPLGIVLSFLSEKALISQESHRAAQMIDASFMERFEESTMELYDPVASPRGALTITDRNHFMLLNTEELYKKFLSRLLDDVESDSINQAPELADFIKTQVRTLKEKIESGDFLQAVKNRYRSKGLETDIASVGKSGGNSRIVEQVYNGVKPFSRPIVPIMHAEAVLRFLFSQVQNLPDDVKILRGSQPYWGVSLKTDNHAYTLTPKSLWDALENSSAEQMIVDMKEKAEKFGNRKLNEDERKKIENAILNSLQEPLRDRLADYLKKHPAKNTTVRGCSLELLNMIMEMSNSTADFKTTRDLIESVILGLDFLISDLPPHIVCGDLNWHQENNGFLYGFAGCYLDGEIHHYTILNGKLYPLQLNLNIEMGIPIPKQFWRPII